ncbi:hypothetical protein DY000_02050265 [Brassica cretica]|uniref:F-box associated beta-propeller type 1 domain-containing protein n=1 Tax=Brassica cretica TaxID=69181 RepID=A0ABQ7F3W1_BRACR|nr:hypothetical protein DY000_02050265 [Brassica cretica]
MDKAPKQCKVLTLSDSKVYSMNVNLNGIHDNVVDPETLQSLNDFHNPKQFKIFKIFHCDGLLLCMTWDFDSWFGTLVLAKSEPQVVDCGIYDFESHSWKDLNDVFPKNCSIVSKAVSLKGNIYCIADKNDEEDLLLSFDFSTEKFRCLSLRFPSVVDDFVPAALSVVREERLSVLYSVISHTRPKIEIWMTTHDKIDQTKLVSWSKFLSLELDENNPQIDLSSETTFFIDEEHKVAVLCETMGFTGKDMVCIVGEDNRLMKIPRGAFKWPLIFNYVPSLVRIQQGGVMTRERKRKNRH